MEEKTPLSRKQKIARGGAAGLLLGAIACLAMGYAVACLVCGLGGVAWVAWHEGKGNL
jgi:hypothetical protein